MDGGNRFPEFTLHINVAIEAGPGDNSLFYKILIGKGIAWVATVTRAALPLSLGDLNRFRTTTLIGSTGGRPEMTAPTAASKGATHEKPHRFETLVCTHDGIGEL